MNDNEYVKERNKLIPQAVRYADNIAGKEPEDHSREAWADKWNKLFHTKMNELAKEKGLLNWGGRI